MAAVEQVQASVGRGVAFTLARYAVVVPVSLLASIVLARLLTPAEFGAFTTMMVLVMGIGSLFELGLMSVLIQQPQAPTVLEQRTVFTFYLLLFGGLAALMWTLAPWLATWFRLPDDGTQMLRWMTPHLLFGAFGCVSLARLERELRFGVLSAAEVAGLLLDKGLAVALAWSGFGVWSFIWASLVAGSVRIGLTFLAAPWRMGLALDRDLMRSYLGRGIYFQGINLASLARDNMLTFLGGGLFGPRAVGLLNWAQNLPALVTTNAGGVFQKVFFPAFARLADAPAAREALLCSSLRTFLLAVLPLIATLPWLGEALVAFVYGPAWREALPVLGLFVGRMGAAAFTLPLLTYLNALGEARASWRLMMLGTTLEWSLAVALAPGWGFYGLAMGAAAGAGLLALAAIWYVRRFTRIPWLGVAGPAITLALLLAAGAAAGAPGLSSLLHLLALLLALGGLWLLGVAYFERERWRPWLAGQRWRRETP